MTHHQFGSIAGSQDIGGTFALGDAILLREKTTVAVDSISGDKRVPIVALELSGRVNKTKDTVQTVWVMSALDAGALARFLHDACERMSPDEVSDFRVGWSDPGVVDDA